MIGDSHPSRMVASLSARGARRGRDLARRTGEEIRAARLAAGLSQRVVAEAARISRAELSRIERGDAPWLSVVLAARTCAIVGLDFWIRAYPATDPLRDLGHAHLVAAFRTILPPSIRVRTEVPIGPASDLRAWDMVIADDSSTVPAEFETRLTDAQAFARRASLKLRDGPLPVGAGLILVLADTRANRVAYAASRPFLEPIAPAPPDEVLTSLRSGRIPERGGVVFIRPPAVARARARCHAGDRARP